jgi:hypothetical protein
MNEAVVYRTEEEFRQWFDQNFEKVGVKRIILSQEVCPDYVVEMQDGTVAKIEAELFAINFKYHRHNPAKADYILACYAKEEKVEGVPVIAINKLWDYEPQPLSPLPPEGPLSDDELTLMSTIDFYGSIEISALCTDEFSGDRLIFRRVPPEFIASWPRGTIDDNIFNIISPHAKEYIKKYHHILIGANLSERACETIELLSRRRLIKTRPMPFISAAYDGVIVDHDGWVPTEVYLTPDAKKYHNEAMIDCHLKQIKEKVSIVTTNTV